MQEFSVAELRTLAKDSLKLNEEIVKINELLDKCYNDMGGMADVSDRIAKVFKLYGELISEIKKQ